MSHDRRAAVGFDPDFFAKLAAGGQPAGPLEAFRHAYHANHWGGGESRSGPGSSLAQTEAIREALPGLLHHYHVRTLLDLPCGDGRWLSAARLAGIEYIGADLLAEALASASVWMARPGARFLELDLTSSTLPPADLLLCRDCLVHLSFADITRALENLHRSSITYLLTTTFPSEPANVDVQTGDWRPLNLALPPFRFPEPLMLINERCTEQDGLFADKSLALWRVADLPRPEAGAETARHLPSSRAGGPSGPDPR